METRQHIHEENFSVSPERLFGLLFTPSAIRQWWGASTVIVIPEIGGIWCATWGENEDSPEYISAATIQVFESPHRMVLSNYKYNTQSGGLPFEADFEVDFLVSKHPEGSTLKVCQNGFPVLPEADEYFSQCVVGWEATFKGIREYLQASGG